MKHKFKSHQFEKKAGIISLQNGRRKAISFKHRKTKQKNKKKSSEFRNAAKEKIYGYYYDMEESLVTIARKKI